MTNNRFIYTILASFIAGMLLLVFIQYNSSRSIDQLIDGNRLLLRDMTVGNDLREMERDILSVEGEIRAAVATSDSTFVQRIDQKTSEAVSILDTLRRAADLDTGSKADIEQLLARAKEKRSRKDTLVDSFLRRGRKAPTSLITNTRVRDAAIEINDLLVRLYMRRKVRLAGVSASVTKYGRIARTSGIILITLVLLTASGLFWFIIERIRKQNQLIRQLDASERKLQDAVTIKENFMANMSHEIRTPLNSIIGFTGLLAKQPLNADSQEFVEAIGASGENLLAIINDILDLSKIEAGMMRVEQRPFSVRQLFQSVETLFQHRMREKGLALDVGVSPEVPETLMGDATRLTQILVNLISNAMKFTDIGGVTVKASAVAAGNGAVQLWVEVRDTGIGISKHQLAAIFERFSQAESSTTRKYGGTGLGLAIVKELITLQHGEINVESVPGKGTTFRFFIPYDIVAIAPSPVVSPVEVVAHAPLVAGACVLVADDNRMNQRLMEHLLSRAGIAFDIVDDGQKVIERLRQKDYDLVLMDIQMPVMDGYTASRVIREELRSTVPIVAMTAHAMPGEREKCLASGMNEYLSKPIEEAALFRMIGKFAKRESAGAEEYHYIDTSYLRELSRGDREYEIEMTDRFLEAVPMELGLLGSALSAGDRALAGRLAHNLKTTVSIMGLTEKLSLLLDALEYPDEQSDLFAAYTSLRQLCEHAMEEAQRFRR